MVKVGRVVSIDHKDKSGIILDYRGRRYLFIASECRDEALPPLNSRVSFLPDDEFVFCNVAMFVTILEKKQAA